MIVGSRKRKVRAKAQSREDVVPDPIVIARRSNRRGDPEWRRRWIAVLRSQ